MIEQRPASGSCARCRASLGLASLKRAEAWYCSPACAEGRPTGVPRRRDVPEGQLYAVPRRFFGVRKPKELRCADRSR